MLILILKLFWLLLLPLPARRRNAQVFRSNNDFVTYWESSAINDDQSLYPFATTTTGDEEGTTAKEKPNCSVEDLWSWLVASRPAGSVNVDGDLF